MNQKKQLLNLFVCFIVLCVLIGSYTIFNTAEPTQSALESSVQSSDVSEQSIPISQDISQGDTTSQEPSQPTAEESSEDTVPVIAYPVGYIDTVVNANYSVLFDATGNTTLYSKNGDKKCYPASITKLLTAAVALDYIAIDAVITVGYEINMIGEGSSIAFLKRGDKLTMEMLLDALLLPSGNDAAYTMAYTAGCAILGDNNANINEAISAFCQKMNQKAAEIGCSNTNFVNPDGYHDWDHYTTPNDLVKISINAMKYSAIRASVQKTQVTHTFVSGDVMSWTNSNKLLSMVDYATGLKTGTTNQSGHCLAASATIDGRDYIAIIIGANGGQQRFDDAVTMFNALISQPEE